MWRIVVTSCLVLSMWLTVACGGQPVTERLSGTWTNPLVKYQFDFTAGTMTMTAIGATDTKRMTIVSQDATSVVVRTDGDPITITLVDDTTATIMQPGKIPMQVKRSP